MWLTHDGIISCGCAVGGVNIRTQMYHPHARPRHVSQYWEAYTRSDTQQNTNMDRFRVSSRRWRVDEAPVMFITGYEPYNVEPVARPVGGLPIGAVVFANLWGGPKFYGMVVVEKHKTFVKAAWMNGVKMLANRSGRVLFSSIKNSTKVWVSKED